MAATRHPTKKAFASSTVLPPATERGPHRRLSGTPLVAVEE